MRFDSLVASISSIHSLLQEQAAHSVNLALTARNWLMGCYIEEFEQHGEDRAAYGERLLKRLEERLRTKGLTERRFREFRRVYLTYPQLKAPVVTFITRQENIRQLLTAELKDTFQYILQPSMDDEIRRSASAELTGEAMNFSIEGERIFCRIPATHLIMLSAIEDPVKRAFYEIETMKGCWTIKELDRQISSLYYERSGMSKNKEALSALVKQQTVSLQPTDVINTPVTLEFLGLSERALVTESELEQALTDHMQNFLLELGHGFCFEARQKRILIDNDYYFVDLVFYHRILKCHIICEIKADRFRHEHASQLNLYLNYYKAEVMQPDDNPPIGILLCTDRSDTLVKYATAGLDPNIFVQKYMVQLPSEEDIKQYILKEQNEISPP